MTINGCPWHLVSPPVMPSRFQGRIKRQMTMGHIQCIQIDSEGPPELQKRTIEALGQGVWICYQDTLPKGGLPALQVVSMSTYYGIPIESNLVREIHSNHGRLQSGHQLSVTDEPMILYHGTSKDSVRSIAKEGLKPSKGMLGHAYYMGSFWKAYRYAVMDSTWTPRTGALFRVMTFWSSMFLRTPDCPKCACVACLSWKQSHGSEAVHPASDHDATWKRTHDAVIVLPYVTTTGTWLVKNEEVACKNAHDIFLESVAFVATRSLVTHRDPLRRDLWID